MTGSLSERASLLETLENSNPENRFVCEHTSSEITSLCPFSGNPDFYTLFFQYEPEAHLIELKSLKLFLTSYRNEKVIHEDLLNSIFNFLKDAVKPRWMYAELIVNVRGGIGTTVKRFWSSEGGDNVELAMVAGENE